jgi:hypothetical protein
MRPKKIWLTGMAIIGLLLFTQVPSFASPGGGGSVIGRIAGVTSDGFAMQVAADDGRMIMYFLLGPGTRIEGELKIGINAGVEYMALGSCNLATHVMADLRTGSYSSAPLSITRAGTVFRVFA